MRNKSVTWDRWKSLEDKAEHGAWARASAYLVFRGADLVGRIRFAYPKDGAGKLQVFVVDMTTCGANALDNPMASRFYGSAGGFGYDKPTAAMGGCAFWGVTLEDQGRDWKAQLEGAGLTVHWAL